MRLTKEDGKFYLTPHNFFSVGFRKYIYRNTHKTYYRNIQTRFIRKEIHYNEDMSIKTNKYWL